MSKQKGTENNRRSTGVVVDKDVQKENAKRPTIDSGYDTVAVVQYADESDESYQKRVDDFETRKRHAEELKEFGNVDLTDERKDEIRKEQSENAKAAEKEAISSRKADR